ncbi:MAG: putative hydrolase or acyltransferase of alpha/beta superfamily [Actinomycetia bacterium]|nr:putative hydrolase or acyltransferase of alpha/beta superfamily [Actinomycetes bacterium]
MKGGSVPALAETPTGNQGAHRYPLPLGRRIDLPDEGTTFVREVSGPPGAPTLLLLHGWMASAGLNWFSAFEPLSRHFNVVAPDLRGHARGLRSRRVFRLADCADDCALTLEQLGSGPVIAVGYSMGGPVAQLFWRRHRDLCAGLVLCATSMGFVPVTRDRIVFTAMMAALAATTRLGGWGATRLPGLPKFAFAANRAPGSMPEWAAAEFRRHDWRMIVEAGHSLSTFHSGRWTNEIDVPTAVVVTAADRAVSPFLQRNMAQSIPSASMFEVDDGHIACMHDTFAVTLTEACLDVADRIAYAPSA